MLNTPNLYGLIKAAAPATQQKEHDWPVYQAPEGGSLTDRVFGAMRRGDVDSARAAAPWIFEGRSTGGSTKNQAPATPTPGISTAITGGAMPTFTSNIDTSVQGSIPSPEEHRAAQVAAGLDENGMPISLDPPEAKADSDALLRKIQADNAAPTTSSAPAPEGTNTQNTRATASTTTPGGRAPRTSTPARTATTPNLQAFRNITAADMRKYRRYTGAANMNSEMDKWKTWQAMQGNRNASNADYYAARAKGFR